MSGLAGAVVAVVVSGLVGGLTEEVCWLAQLTAHIVLTGGGDPLDLNISTISVRDQSGVECVLVVVGTVCSPGWLAVY